MSLSLIHAMSGFQARLVSWLVEELNGEGFDGLTGPALTFLGTLDCGENYASSLARELGVTRQAVHKQVREMEALGWLETKPHPDKGNQRVIVFTEEGERMMSVARSKFAALDQKLVRDLGADPRELAERLSSTGF